MAAAVTFLAYLLVRGKAPEKARRGYRWGQVGSGSLVALAHGTNDAQKTMGVIVLALVSYGALPNSGFSVPTWVIVAAATAIALGTYFGGWRIIRTVGQRVTDIDTPQGFSAETSSAAVILASSALGFPLSTTHVASGGVAGSGFGRYRHLRSIRWDVARNIVLAWLLTLPGAALIAGVVGLAVVAPGDSTVGALVVGVLAAAGATGLWWIAQRAPVTPDNVNEA